MKISRLVLTLIFLTIMIISCSGKKQESISFKSVRNNVTINSTILPKYYVQMLGRGIDVSWSENNNYTKLYNSKIVKDFRNAGFTSVRIRINHKNFNLSALKKQVTDCINNGIIPIIAFQGHYIEDKAKSDQDARQHLVNFWKNIAEEFQGYSHKLAFDILVEISGKYKKNYKAINSFYADVLSVIRKTNPDRIVIFSPVKLSSPNYLKYLKIPGNNDPYTMAEWHFYAAGPSPDSSSKKYWKNGATTLERKNITNPINTAVKWMKKTGYKTWVGAWMPGNYNKGNNYNTAEQVDFASFMVRELNMAHIPWSVNAGHQFYDYKTDTWIPQRIPVRDVIMNPNKVALYPAVDYGGNSYRLSPGSYDENDLKEIGFEKKIKSIMVPFEFKVELYSLPGYQGTEKVLTQTTGNLNGFDVQSLKIIRVSNLEGNS